MLGFACGSIPFGWLAGRLHGTDVRRSGSGNIGFTNVQRTMGWAWALPVLLLDAAKGVLPVVFAPGLGLKAPLVGLGAVCGHVFTPWLGFGGGKGVATTIGASAVLCPRSLLAGLGAYLLVLLVSGFISLASLSLALFLPLLVALFYRGDTLLLGCSIGASLLIILRHRANVDRLSKGSEPRLSLWLRLFRRGSQ
jgi:glycerol-3-phosphate acyltransferase PlsY